MKIKLIAKTLYEQEWSAGYWHTKMSRGDKVKWVATADQILALIKEAGYKSPEDCELCNMSPAWRLVKHARDGYVKLAENQELPAIYPGTFSSHLNTPSPETLKYVLDYARYMQEQKWRAVILEEKDGS